MNSLSLQEFHQQIGARFFELTGQQAVNNYGDVLAEHTALRQSAGVLDLSSRGRLCLLGADRQRFLNGQVTNNVAALQVGEGCYAALITAKGKMLSDLNIYLLENEILLDFEPGLVSGVTQRLENYIIADDVQIADVTPHYGLLSVQGPKSEEVIRELGFKEPARLRHFVKEDDAAAGEIYIVNMPRSGTNGFDLFVPLNGLGIVWDKLISAAKSVAGRACGWQALEIARIEAGIPRFGVDMNETNLPPEAGLEASAISYTKGCYIGQEVIARRRTYGQVAKALRGLRLSDDLKSLPQKGDKLFKNGKEIGFITSSVASPARHANLALGYVRREANQIRAELILRTAEGESPARIVELPF